MAKLRWGILSTAQIGRNALVPAIQQSESSEVVAVASRNHVSAVQYAQDCNIPSALGSYEALLEDEQVDAIYNPLPNHMHIPWTIKCIEAGKHVLCEKPLGMNADDLKPLFDCLEKHPDIKVMEAFMYRFHPQWNVVHEIINSGQLGELSTVESTFCYHNVDGSNIRNIAEVGGGALMDVGCYCISVARFIFGQAPTRVIGRGDIDENFKTDRHMSALMDFPNGSSTFYCSTQSEGNQRVKITGTEGALEIFAPFLQRNSDEAARIVLVKDGQQTELETPQANQYTCQVDAFANAIASNSPVPTPLRDATTNMRTIDAIFKSLKTNHWVTVE